MRADGREAQPLLRASGIGKSYGGLAAVSNVDLDVEAGTIHSVIGPNGAGKTTLFNLMTGVQYPDSGSILFKGEEIAGMPQHAMAPRGISRCFQRTQLFLQLPVSENVRIAMQAVGHSPLSMLKKPSRDEREACEHVLAMVGLQDDCDEVAEVLPHGKQKALDIAIALASSPSLLLLDEPTSGMSVSEVEPMMRMVDSLKNEHGITVLLVEHNIELVMTLSDTITVLHEGSVLARGKPADIRASEEVSAAYLGGL